MKELCLSGKKLNLLMESVLDAPLAYRVKVMGRGYSMSPFIKDNSIVLLKPLDTKSHIKFGDMIAAFNHDKSQVFLHRVVGLKNGYYLLKGDNKIKHDGWFPKQNILGIVDEIRGKGWLKKNSPLLNTIIAIGSKSGIFNRWLFPVFRSLRKATYHD